MHQGLWQSKKRKKQAGDILITCIIALGALVVLLPLYWMIRSSIMSNVALNRYPPEFIPKQPLFSNYAETLLTFPFLLYLKNTMTIIVPSIIGAVITSTLAGYAFARLDFPGKKPIFALVIGSMLMPSIVTLIPIFIMWTNVLKIYDSFIPLIVPQFLGGGAFNIFLVRQFMLTIPRELDEAATIDGASHRSILWQIIVPLIKPAMIVVGLLTFIALWNDILGPVVYLNQKENYTISIALNTFKGVYGTNWKNLMAATCMSILPALGLYLVGQKYFIEGIVMTGMKS